MISNAFSRIHADERKRRERGEAQRILLSDSITHRCVAIHPFPSAFLCGLCTSAFRPSNFNPIGSVQLGFDPYISGNSSVKTNASPHFT